MDEISPQHPTTFMAWAVQALSVSSRRRIAEALLSAEEDYRSTLLAYERNRNAELRQAYQAARVQLEKLEGLLEMSRRSSPPETAGALIELLMLIGDPLYDEDC